MKKFMKTCGILALVMILLGIVLTSIGAITAGPTVISSVKNYISDGIAKLDSGVRFNVESDMDFDNDAPVQSGNVVQTYGAEEITGLDVEIGTCQLKILPSEDQNLYVRAESAGSYQGYVSDGTLHLKAISSTGLGASLSTEDNTINLDLQAPGCEITLYVPTDFYFEEVKVSLGAGSVASSTLWRAGELELELAAGEIELSNLEVVSLNAQVGAGTLTYNGSVLGNADVECGMGDIELELSGAETDFNYDVEVAAGDVIIGRESFGGIAGERSINNNASKNINVECAMGTVDITFVAP